MYDLPNAPISDPHVPQTEELQIGDHRLSISCAVVERLTIMVMTLLNQPSSTALVASVLKMWHWKCCFFLVAAVGRQGLPIVVPTVPDLKFIDPVIVSHNIEVYVQKLLV